MICSSPVLEDEGSLAVAPSSSPLLESESLAGEIGIVSSGTGEFGFAEVFLEGACRAAMMKV